MNIVGTLALHFDEFCEYMRQLVPTRGELVIGGTVGTLGMVTNLLFGGWNDTLTLLALFMAIDYVTGVMAAGYTKKLSSKKGLKGKITAGNMLFQNPIYDLIAIQRKLLRIMGSDAGSLERILKWKFRSIPLL